MCLICNYESQSTGCNLINGVSGCYGICVIQRIIFLSINNVIRGFDSFLTSCNDNSVSLFICLKTLLHVQLAVKSKISCNYKKRQTKFSFFATVFFFQDKIVGYSYALIHQENIVETRSA